MMGHPIKQPAPPVTNWTTDEMLVVASRALGKVIRDDVRGMTMLSIDEIAAMTGVLIGFGLIATLPGEEPPDNLIYTPRKEA